MDRTFAKLPFLLGLALWPATRGHTQQPDAAAAVPVTTVVAVQADVAVTLTGIGSARAAQSVTVKTRVDGTLDRVAFREGQDVKAGDLLVQIDPRPYRAALDQALAQKAHDEAALAAANRDLKRYSTLISQNSISQQALDNQQTTVDQAQASLKLDQAQVDNAQVQLGYTTIRAPVSGRTGLRLVDAGNVVHATDTTGLVVINQIDPIAVVFVLPERNFQQVNRAVQAGYSQPLKVTATGRDTADVLGTGKLVLIDNQIDSSTGTFQLKAEFANPQHTLWPGEFVSAHLTLGTLSKAVTVPSSAVQRGADGFQVYTVQPDNTVAVRPVQIGQSDGQKTVIDSGLTAGTRVITDGTFKVRSGSRVTEADAKGKGATSGRP